MMDVKTIDLAKEYGLKGGSLECLCLAHPYDIKEQAWQRPAVIVVPGGGYGMCSQREAGIVATSFLARGFQAFVLRYAVHADGAAYPEQLLELAAAFDYVRKNAKQFAVNADEVFAVGFSAGGHLVADLACEHMTVEEKYGKPLDCTPTAVGLSYPVIYYEGHKGSYHNLLGNLPEAERERLLPTLNLDERVTADASPAFIWSTFEDGAVPCENSLRYASAMAKAGVRFALQVYPFGQHGMSIATKEISSQYGEAAMDWTKSWVDDCCKFFRIYVKE